MSWTKMRTCGIVLITIAMLSGCGSDQDTERTFEPFSGDRWIGNAISYGPHRDGQRPGGPSPSVDQIREDLHLMISHWNLMRIYGSTGVAETILTVIQADSLDMKVMLGVWIDVEEKAGHNGSIEQFPEAVTANKLEVAAAIRLANTYPDIVIAISVGNETQVSWSAHRSPLPILIDHLRTVRDGVSVPVTVADDFNFWNKPESVVLDGEVDFITMHAHPMWNGLQLDDALPWVVDQLEVVQSMHPDQTLILGETGWATSVHDEGEQSRLIKGEPGEDQQKVYHDRVRSWAEVRRFTVFFFEAFDENWKGGSHPNEVEKHWGLFRADRSSKQALGQSKGP